MISPDEAGQAWERIKGFITNREAEIVHEERWGTRRLAYPRQEGTVPVPGRKLPPHAFRYRPDLQPRTGELPQAGRQRPQVAGNRHGLRRRTGSPRRTDPRSPAPAASGRRTTPGRACGSGSGACRPGSGRRWSCPSTGDPARGGRCRAVGSCRSRATGGSRGPCSCGGNCPRTRAGSGTGTRTRTASRVAESAVNKIIVIGQRGQRPGDALHAQRPVGHQF